MEIAPRSAPPAAARLDRVDRCGANPRRNPPFGEECRWVGSPRDAARPQRKAKCVVGVVFFPQLQPLQPLQSLQPGPTSRVLSPGQGCRRCGAIRWDWMERDGTSHGTRSLTLSLSPRPALPGRSGPRGPRWSRARCGAAPRTQTPSRPAPPRPGRGVSPLGREGGGGISSSSKAIKRK